VIYRVKAAQKIQFDGQRILLVPEEPYDDDDAFTRRLIERFPGFFYADNVEQATASPGEKRNVRAKK